MGKKSTFRKVGRPSTPKAIENTYWRKIREIIQYAHDLVKERVFPQLERIHAEARSVRGDRADAYSDSVDMLFQLLRAAFALQFSDQYLRNIAQQQAEKLSTFNKQNMTRLLANAIGVEVFFAEPWLKAEMETFVKMNVDLIKTVPATYFNQIEQAVLRAVQSGTRVEDLKDEIESRFQPAMNHSELIARDQTLKFNGNLNKLRQTELGIDKYIWSTSKDERVRGNPEGLYPNADPSHFELEGTVQSWDDPPEPGHPGEDYQCRCVPIPYLEGLGDEGESEGE